MKRSGYWISLEKMPQKLFQEGGSQSLLQSSKRVLLIAVSPVLLRWTTNAKSCMLSRILSRKNSDSS